MKRMVFAIGILFLTSCSVEERLMSWSYTNQWYWRDNDRYQVYKTVTGRKYIIIIDEKKLIQKREYIKVKSND